jgi:hypothetical protein
MDSRSTRGAVTSIASTSCRFAFPLTGSANLRECRRRTIPSESVPQGSIETWQMRGDPDASNPSLVHWQRILKSKNANPNSLEVNYESHFHIYLSLIGLNYRYIYSTQECLAKRLLPRTRPFCGADILPTEDQMCIGSAAARRLQEEVKKLRTWDWRQDQSERRAMKARECCHIARRWKLPCIHLLPARADFERTPLLTLADFPEWVKLAPLTLGLHGVHDIGLFDIHSSLRAPRCDRTEILAALEPLVNAAVRGCPHAQECIADVLQRFNRRPQAETGAVFIYPVRTSGPWRQNVHPGRASLLAVMQPRKKSAGTDGPPKRFCSYCHAATQDRRKCPLRIEHEKQGS